jgi:coenzyme PQQ synthesis protein D (PqqD)
MTELPKLVAGLEINKVADGYIVYQPARDRVHYLNHTATIVLELCNGQNSPSEIAGLLQSAYDLPAPPETEVAACLLQLRSEELVA